MSTGGFLWWQGYLTVPTDSGYAVFAFIALTTYIWAMLGFPWLLRH